MEDSERTLGPVVNQLIRASDFSQTEICDLAGVSKTNLNKFLNGHAGLSSENLIKVLKSVGVDLESLVKEKIAEKSASEFGEISSDAQALEMLLSRLDKMGRQIYLAQLAWAATLTSRRSLPKNLDRYLKERINHI